MIRRQKLSSEVDPLFQFSWDLYVASFPDLERREMDYHLEAMQKGEFNADVLLDEDQPIGILFWWDLREFRYIEHLTTSPNLRGGGYGAKTLQAFIAESPKPIILEVEPPTQEINRRRITFYERIGFHQNDHPHSQPSYRQIEGESIELIIMTYPEPISEQSMQRFTDLFLSVVHFRN